MNQDILLTVTTLQNFITQSSTSDTSQIRSLTISIDSNELPQTSIQTEIGDRIGTEGARQLWSQLERFANLLPAFSNLATFSLNVISQSQSGFWIPRPLIARLVIALPRTCIAIQIDTRGQDLGDAKSAHLCNAIRTILPQLQHLYLRLGTVCDNLFQTEAEVIGAPNLETLLINCIARNFWGDQARLCNSFEEVPYCSGFYLGKEAVPILVISMKAFILRCPKITHMLLIDCRPGDNEDQSVYATFNRRNIIHDKIYCMPFRYINPFQYDGVLLRTQEKDIIAGLPELQAFAEEGLWKATNPEGFILPVHLLEDWGYIANELLLLNANEWKVKYPKRSCLLWFNEQKTGQRLLEAVERAGVVNAVIVKEVTPEGWERVCGELFAKE